MQREKNLPFQIFEKHGPAHFTPQAPGLPHAHGPHDFQELVVPTGYQIPDTGFSPGRIDLGNIYRTGNAFSTTSANTAFQGHQQRDIHGNGIGPANDQLGQVFGHGHTAAGQDGNLIPEAVFDQMQMNLFDTIFNKDWSFSLFPSEFIGHKMEDFQT
jgi:hypothetical protein